MMTESIDIFVMAEDKQPKWLCCAKTHGDAVEALSKAGPGSYLVFSQEDQQKIVYVVGEDGQVSLLP